MDLRSQSVRELALSRGWSATKSKNRWILLKDCLGRVQWFETGRIELYVKSPVTIGKVYQLFCHGFSFTGLIDDDTIVGEILKEIRFKGAHYVFETPQRLPSMTL